MATKSRHDIISFYSSNPHLKHRVLHCKYCEHTVCSKESALEEKRQNSARSSSKNAEDIQICIKLLQSEDKF